MPERWSSRSPVVIVPGLQEGARTRAHLGVVAGEEQIGPGPLQDGGSRRRGVRGPGQGGPYLGQVAGEGVPLVGQWADEALVRAQIDSRPASWWVDDARAASCWRAATRRGPAVWGRRRSDWDWPTVPTPAWATCSCGPGEVLHRAELATGHREDVDRPEEGRGQEAVRGAEARLGRAERSGRCAGQDSVGGQALPGRLHRGLAVVDVVGGDHHVDDGGHRPDHHERHHGGGDLPPSGETPAPSGVGLLGPGGEVGARSARARRSSPGGAYCGHAGDRGNRGLVSRTDYIGRHTCRSQCSLLESVPTRERGIVRPLCPVCRGIVTFGSVPSTEFPGMMVDGGLASSD